MIFKVEWESWSGLKKPWDECPLVSCATFDYVQNKSESELAKLAHKGLSPPIVTRVPQREQLWRPSYIPIFTHLTQGFHNRQWQAGKIAI